MVKTRQKGEKQVGFPGAFPVENPKALLKLYYAGQQIPSPEGGHLLFLGVRATDTGSAVALFECSASSLRYQVEIPKATRTERRKVKEQMEEGRDPDCPRHGPPYRLTRAGKELVCTACGVAFGKV